MDKSPEVLNKNNVDFQPPVIPDKDEANASVYANITDFNLDDSEIEVGDTNTGKKTDPS